MIRTVFAIAVFAIALIYAGREDYKAELMERDHYCQMVRDGAWPDYQSIYREECADALAKK